MVLNRSVAIVNLELMLVLPTPTVAAANTLDRQFNPTQLDHYHIRTNKGWLYLAVVIGLFGWSI